MTDKLVSVIIPFYKEIDLLPRAVTSALTQELPSGWALEVVVGNDGRYGAEEIVDACGQHSAPITVVKNVKENGAGNARNAAIDASKGNVLAFLDADDFWLPGKLLSQLDLMAAGCNFVATGYRFGGTDNSVIPPFAVRSTFEFFYRLSVGTSTVVVARKLLQSERFSNLRFSQDTEFWARLFATGRVNFGSIAQVLAVYEPSGRTANKAVQFLRFRAIVREFALRVDQRFLVYLTYSCRGIVNHFVRTNASRWSRVIRAAMGKRIVEN